MKKRNKETKTKTRPNEANKTEQKNIAAKKQKKKETNTQHKN